MSKVRSTAAVASLALAVTTVLVGLPPSAEGAGSTSKTYRVQGVQQPVGQSFDLYTVKSDTGKPGLTGDWAITHRFSQTLAPPWYFETGTETFVGCLDRNGDHSCENDPAGSMSFTYASWVKFDPTTSAELAGGCVHPITGGTGAFQGVRGLITMQDTPRADGSILTTYRGTVSLSNRAGTSATSEAPRTEPSLPASSAAADSAAPAHPRVC